MAERIHEGIAMAQMDQIAREFIARNGKVTLVDTVVSEPDKDERSGNTYNTRTLQVVPTVPVVNLERFAGSLFYDVEGVNQMARFRNIGPIEYRMFRKSETKPRTFDVLNVQVYSNKDAIPERKP